MSLSLTDILAAIQQNHKRDDREATARTGITLAIQELPKFYEFEILRTSIDQPILAEGGSVDLPDGALKVLEVRFMNGILSYALPIQRREVVLRDYPDLDTIPSSYPVKGYLEGTKVYLAPKTAIDATVRINYTILPSFTVDDDTSLLAPAVPLIDKFLIEYATGWVFQSLQMFNEAMFWMTRAGGSLQASIDFDMRKPVEQRRIQPVSTFDHRIFNPLDPFEFRSSSFEDRGYHGT